MNFMNLPKKFSDKEKSKIIIIPLLYEGTVTVGKNASKGPEEIIKASYELEYFDCDLKTEPYTKGIYTHKELKFKETKTNYFDKISQDMLDTLTPLVKQYDYLIILGSDHSTTIPTIQALEKKHKDFGIIIFDAHSDLREPWGKGTWWHACVSNILCKKHKLLISGVRSQDFYENLYLKSKAGKNVSIVYANDLKKSDNHFDLYLKKLPKKVFISIDVDFFDPSIIRNTNTPEPGGFNWFEINNLLQKIFIRKEVIGADITEFAPKGPDWNYKSEAYTLAKLVYKLCVYKFR